MWIISLAVGTVSCPSCILRIWLNAGWTGGLFAILAGFANSESRLAGWAFRQPSRRFGWEFQNR